MIRKIFMLLLPALAAATTLPSAAAERPDHDLQSNDTLTVRVINYIHGQDWDTVNDETDDTLFDDADGKSIWDIETPFSRLFNLKGPSPRRKRHYNRQTTASVGFKNIYIGANNPAGGSDDGMKSALEIGVASVIGGEWRPGPNTTFLLALGFGFSRTGLEKTVTVDKENGALILRPVTEGVKKIKSHIQNFHFTVPLMFTQKFAGSFGISLGAEMHLNTYTTAMSKYTEADGRQVKMSVKGLHQRILTPSLVAILGWVDSSGIYLRYNPCNPWKEGYGPDYQTIGIGLSLAF